MNLHQYTRFTKRKKIRIIIMAEIDPEAPPNSLPQNDDDSENEYGVLNDPDNTQQFSPFENEMKRQVQETILGIN